MAWRQLGDKPLSEAMMIRLLMHICITGPQWVNEMETFWLYNNHNSIVLSRKAYLLILNLSIMCGIGQTLAFNKRHPIICPHSWAMVVLHEFYDTKWLCNDVTWPLKHLRSLSAQLFLNSLFRLITEQTSKLCITGHFVGELSIGWWFAESLSMPWYPHVIMSLQCICNFIYHLDLTADELIHSPLMWHHYVIHIDDHWFR